MTGVQTCALPIYQLETTRDYYSAKLTGFSRFNLAVTPKKNLLRHIEWIKSFYNGIVHFESSSKDSYVTVTDNEGTSVSERSDIDMSKYKDKTFEPYIVEFSSPLDRNLLNSINAKSTGYIQFEYLGSQYMGFILDTSIDASKNSVQEFRLLLTAKNDILGLIH